MHHVTTAGARVLIVDDEPVNLKLLRAMLETSPDRYQVFQAADGLEAIKVVEQCNPDLILLDLFMPRMDGYEVTAHLKADPSSASIPIIIVTAHNDRESRLRGLSLGADDFISKPFDLKELQVRIQNCLQSKIYKNLLESHNRMLENEVAEKVLELAAFSRETILVLLQASEYRDEDTGAHVWRIGAYARAMGAALGLDAYTLDVLYHAAPMHDLGKIGIPDSILLKKGPLSTEEWKVMKTHPALGARILRYGRSPYLISGTEIALGHHERWDGSGYPHGLKGDAIPLFAQITNICDVYDALRSQRPYKPPLAHDVAIEIILKGDGRTRPEHFSPEMRTLFQQREKEFEEIFETLSDHAGGMPPHG